MRSSDSIPWICSRPGRFKVLDIGVAIEGKTILLPKASFQHVGKAPNDPSPVHVVGGITSVKMKSDGGASGADVMWGDLEVGNQLDPHG